MSGSVMSDDDFLFPNPSFRNVTRTGKGSVNNSRASHSALDRGNLDSITATVQPVLYCLPSPSFVAARRRSAPPAVVPLPLVQSRRSGASEDDLTVVERSEEQASDVKELPVIEAPSFEVLSQVSLPESMGPLSIAFAGNVEVSTKSITDSVPRQTADDAPRPLIQPVSDLVQAKSETEPEPPKPGLENRTIGEAAPQSKLESLEQDISTIEVDCNDESVLRIESVRQSDRRSSDLCAPMTRDFALYAAQTLLDSDIMPSKDRNNLRRAIEGAVGPFKQREARRLAIMLLGKPDSKLGEKISRSYKRMDTLCLDCGHPPWLQFSIDILNEIARMNRGACHLLVYRSNSTGDYHLEIANQPPAQNSSGQSFLLAALELSSNDGVLTAGGRYRTFSDSFCKVKSWRP